MSVTEVERAYAGYRRSQRKQRSWSAANPGNAAIRAELVSAVWALAGPTLCTAADILDVGCGTGWWLAELARDDRIAGMLRGLELLPERHAAATARVPDASVRRGDARRLPYDAGSVDVVTLFTLLSSLPSRADAVLALRDAQRVLRPGGALLVWEPRIPTPGNRDTRLIDRATLRAGTAGLEARELTLTVLPPLARRLGARTDQLYPLLSRVPALRTHRLMCATRPRS